MKMRGANSANDIAVATSITFTIVVIITTTFGSNVIYYVNTDSDNEDGIYFKENMVDICQKGAIIINNTNHDDSERG